VVDVIITHFLELGKKLQSHSKATPKPLQSIKPLKIKHLMKFFGVLEFTPKTYPKTHHTLLARFLHTTRPFFLYISLSLQKLQKQKQKINQIIERVRFEAFGVVFGVALEWLWSFLTNSKKCIIIKPHQAPTLDPFHHQTVEIQALHDTNQTLETQALSEVPSKLNNVLRFF